MYIHVCTYIYIYTRILSTKIVKCWVYRPSYIAARNTMVHLWGRGSRTGKPKLQGVQPCLRSLQLKGLKGFQVHATAPKTYLLWKQTVPHHSKLVVFQPSRRHHHCLTLPTSDTWVAQFPLTSVLFSCSAVECARFPRSAREHNSELPRSLSHHATELKNHPFGELLRAWQERQPEEVTALQGWCRMGCRGSAPCKNRGTGQP